MEPVQAGTEWLLWTGGAGVGLFVVALLVWVVARQAGSRRAGRPGELETDEASEPMAGHSESAASLDTEVAAPPVPSLFERFQSALGRSRAALQGRFDELFGRGRVDEELFEELEETLLAADVSLSTTEQLLAPLREQVRAGEAEPAELREALREGIAGLLQRVTRPPLTVPDGVRPWVVLVVGVNGSGKTTTIGKLAARYVAQGHSVLLAAGDTYRAGAIDQLAVWADRAGADLVRHDPGGDPGAVVYDALTAAKARGRDVVLIDTAGRLQTARPLMEQLAKVRRVIAKVQPDAPHETLLVLDGTMGQNGLSQASTFGEATPLSGVAITKLDGTAKGGMVLTLAAELGLPVRLVGIGEKVEDLRDFEVEPFVRALT